jgi:hypothetical protein
MTDATKSPSGDNAPTQRTPKGHEIPVPKRADFMRDLKKVAPPPPKK